MLSRDFQCGLQQAAAQLKELKRIEQPWLFADFLIDIKDRTLALQAAVIVPLGTELPAGEQLLKHVAALTLALAQDRMGLGDWAEEIRRLSELVPAIAALEQLPLRRPETGAEVIELDAWRSRRDARRYLRSVGLRSDLPAPTPDGVA